MGRLQFVLALMVLVRPGWAEDEGYAFRLDGDQTKVEVLSLSGTPEHPAPGDLVFVAGFSFVLGAPGLYDLTLTDKRDRLQRRRSDGKMELIGLNLPPDAIPDVDVEMLRSVRLRKWGPKSEEFLSTLDLSHVCVMVHSWAGSFDRVPPLPKGVRYLWIGGVKGGPGAWDTLDRLTELRVLVAPRPSLPVDRLSGARELRVLSAPAEEDVRLRWRARAKVLDPSRLAGLRELRHLDLKYAEGLDDLSFLTSMPHLVRLEVSGTSVPVLPEVRLPELRVVRALACLGPNLQVQPEMDLASVSRFRALNPWCRVTAGWTELFREAMAPVTRVRLRTGGNRADSAKEETLCNVSDAAELRALVAGVQIDGGRSGGYCYCDGGPTLELYKGAEILAVVSIQHVHRLRWIDGSWPGDAELTKDSMVFIGRWLARHGAPGPLRSVQSLLARWEALAERRRIQSRILGAGLAARLQEGQTADDRIASFREAVPAATDRAILWLRLFGGHEGTWGRTSELETSLGDELDESVSSAAREEALRRAIRSEDPTLPRGAARWFFAMEGWRQTPSALLAELLPVLARCALAHPRPLNRRVTLAALEKIGTDAAVSLIEAHFRGEIEPRPVPADQLDESPTRYLAFFRRPASDRAQAALCLARLGRVEHLEKIQRMLEGATGEDRALLSAAVTWLRDR